MKQAITFSADRNYIDYAIAITSSIKNTNTRGDIVCRCVNWPVTDINMLQSKGVDIIDDRTELSDSKHIIKDNSRDLYYKYGVSIVQNGLSNIKDIMYSEESVYTCHSRFKNINTLLSKGYEQIICLDVDTLLVKNCDSLYRYVDDDDIASIITYIQPGDIIEYRASGPMRNNTTSAMRCLFDEGLLVVRNTDTSVNLWREVEHLINDSWREWNADFDIICDLINSKYNQLKINDVPKTYKDTNCDPESYMWSGESITKTTDQFKLKIESLK